MGCGCGPGETCDDMDNEMISAADLARFGDESDYGHSCIECGEEIYEDTALCPQCGAFQEATPTTGLAADAASNTLWRGMNKILIPVGVALLVIAFAWVF